jgi:hypothetical protein
MNSSIKHLDILKENFNIALGQAVSYLAKNLDIFIEMPLPYFLSETDQYTQYLQGNKPESTRFIFNTDQGSGLIVCRFKPAHSDLDATHQLKPHIQEFSIRLLQTYFKGLFLPLNTLGLESIETIDYSLCVYQKIFVRIRLKSLGNLTVFVGLDAKMNALISRSLEAIGD